MCRAQHPTRVAGSVMLALGEASVRAGVDLEEGEADEGEGGALAQEEDSGAGDRGLLPGQPLFA